MLARFFTIGTNDITHLTNPNFNSSHPKRKESFSRQQLVCILNICDIVLPSRGGKGITRRILRFGSMSLSLCKQPRRVRHALENFKRAFEVENESNQEGEGE